jgi:hypothetical protein
MMKSFGISSLGVDDFNGTGTAAGSPSKERSMADHRDAPKYPGGPIVYPLTPKLVDFYQGLPPGQQQVFSSIMQAAAAQDVRGFGQPTDVQEAMEDAFHVFREHLQTP